MRFKMCPLPFITMKAREGKKPDKSVLEADLETALDLAGAGKYQVFHCALMVSTLGAAILEMIGCAFLLPSAACDLDLPDHMRGIITSIPNIGIILTAPFWGPTADALGRKPVLIVSTLLSGLIGLLAAFMPSLLTYALCKFIGSLFLSCPSSLGFAFLGELMPKMRRDMAVLTCNASLMLVASLCPILAWIVFSIDWELQSVYLRPWRILTIAYSMPLILSSLWMTQTLESPKFLMMKGKENEALNVLAHIFSFNTGLDPDEYKVTSLKKSADDRSKADGQSCESGKKSKTSAIDLLKPPHVQWLLLIGFLMLGLFSLLNGLFLFTPHTINTLMRQSANETASICKALDQIQNSTHTVSCSISYETFQITVITALIYGALVMLASLSPLSKKTLLISMYAVVGTACLISGIVQNRLVAGVSMSTLELTALGIGPLNAYAVQIFPTSLRGTAVGAVMMFGRVGSMLGANMAGIFLARGCTYTFCAFATLLFLCACLSTLLPSDKTKREKTSL
ncbi:organic cation/carnitine transporter 7-like [Colias croceus]|uniref:organic cation/carnitine transporter 7-like n=1 Tax=Colias crocea TaxID=72248 RepID=UPI001E280E24|nr:organic cation/carnitine transporter 7-like [Colias croceus]